MPPTVSVRIEPNEKYRRVISTYTDPEPAEEPWEEWPEEHQEAADGYVEVVDSAPSAEELDKDPDDLETLSWDLLSVASDPDLAAKMATYFDGVDSDEPTEKIRAKLRLLHVEDYADVQLAARQELRRQ